MSDFIYFLTSLPMLRLDMAPSAHLSFDEYVSRCRDNLSPKEADAIANLRLTPPDDFNANGNLYCEEVKYWYEFETELRNAAIRVHARNRRIQEGAQWQHAAGMEYAWLEKSMEKILTGQTSAYDKELALHRLRWRFLDQAAAAHQFDFFLAVIYGVRLLILAQLEQYDAELGRIRFDANLSAVLEHSSALSELK